MIDFKYAEKLAEKIVGEVVPRTKTGFARSMIADYDGMREAMIGEVTQRLWDRLLSKAGAFRGGEPLTQSEKALACIIRKGVGKGSINLQDTTATIPLRALTYRISKLGAGFSAVPCVGCLSTWSNLPMRWISLSGEDFADFMFEFDSFAGSIPKKIDSQLLKEKVLAMQYSIICRTVGQLGEQYLEPAGITWTVGCGFSGVAVTVTFRREGYKKILETIKFDELAEVIAGIPARMERQPKVKKRGWITDCIV